jgi:flavin reductase (DIM6/NTAB) family NADH-FMN oxidoreductase RutF
MTEAPGPAADPDAFRHLMARWATGVSVVTSRDGEHDSGLTVNALASVSLHPPSVVVSLMTAAETTPVVQRSRRFGVTVLAHDQRPLSERFARAVPSAEKFAGISVRRGETGVALFDGGLAWFECAVREELPSADHILFVGEVVHAEAGRDEAPLLFFRAGYAERLTERNLALPAPRAPRA